MSLRYGCNLYVATVKDKIHTREMDLMKNQYERGWLVCVRAYVFVCYSDGVIMCAYLYLVLYNKRLPVSLSAERVNSTQMRV